MTQQAVRTSLSPVLESHLHFGVGNCPTCGQEIPPNKLEEISGKIAAKQRELALAITAQLEKHHAIEKDEADARAKADLELERQQSAIREARVRDEVQKAAENVYGVKLAEAEQARADLAARWQQQLEEAQSAQRSGEQLRTKLQAETDNLRANNAAAIQAIKAESDNREKEIRNDANQAAEAAAAERIAAIETAQRESQVELIARISEEEAGRVAAEQNQSRLTAELDKLRNSNEAEIAKVKEDAATELLRVRQLATQEAEVRIHGTLAAKEAAVAEASEKARQAETELRTLADQHASQMEVHLKEQREILEKAKEEAVNAEKARAFEENQKLSTKLADLQRAWENKTAEELGEGAEIKLLEELKKEFKGDRIEHIPRGAQGADIRHVVMLNGRECGTILYDSKNHKQWRDDHAAKLRKDQLAEKAEHAILSTHKFPRDAQQLHFRDGVLLANPARVVAVVKIIRQHLLQLHTLRVSKVEREKKTATLYAFITSERCRQLLDRVDQRAGALLDLQEKEIRWHQKNWEHQGMSIRAIQKAKADLAGEINSIIGVAGSEAEAS